MSHFDDIRTAHHTKAKLIASGRSTSDVAHILAISESALARLLCDPTFRDLVSRYRRSEVAVGASQRFHYLCAA